MSIAQNTANSPATPASAPMIPLNSTLPAGLELLVVEAEGLATPVAARETLAEVVVAAEAVKTAVDAAAVIPTDETDDANE